MIAKECPLDSKYRLQAVLNHICPIEEITDKLEFCKGCSFNKEEKMKWINDKSFEQELEIWAKWIGIKETR